MALPTQRHGVSWHFSDSHILMCRVTNWKLAEMQIPGLLQCKGNGNIDSPSTKLKNTNLHYKSKNFEYNMSLWKLQPHCV